MASSLAAQVAAQSRPSIPPIPVVTLPPSSSPITLKELDQRFRALIVQHRRTLGEMVFLSFRLCEASDWEKLGYSDAESYADSVGISYAYFRRLATLGERLQFLTVAEIQNLPLRAMSDLTKVHPSIWNEYPWIEEAKALTAREFSALVMRRNEQAGVSLCEPRTQLTLRVPLSLHPVMERRLETIRRQEGLGSVAEALSFALESVDEKYLLAETLTEIQKQMQELSRIQDSLKETSGEKANRLENGEDAAQIRARARASKLAASILRTIGEVVEISEEEVQVADSGETLSPV
jgi:hypothetical protein